MRVCLIAFVAFVNDVMMRCARLIDHLLVKPVAEQIRGTVS